MGPDVMVSPCVGDVYPIPPHPAVRLDEPMVAGEQTVASVDDWRRDEWWLR